MHQERCVTRRGFVAAGAAALAAAGAGASATAYAKVPANAADGAGSFAYPTSVDDDPYFAAPEPITDIVETYDYDVVVVGAGASGIPAACAAVDNGARVAVLQKSPRVYSHGVLWSAWNAPSMVEERGETTPEQIAELKAEFMALNHYGTQPGLLNKFFAEVGEAMEWQIQEVRKVGQPLMISNGDDPLKRTFMMFNQTSLTFAAVADDYIQNKGLDVYFSTPALQLVRDADGRVIGVIAQDREGNNLQFNAAKGVIIATGGYGANKELVARWLPAALPYTNGCCPEDNTGDGAMMAIWAGAAVCPLRSVKTDIRFYGDHSGRTNIEKQPFLMVNDRGQRIGNENATEMQHGSFVTMNPSESGHYYCIFDSSYGDWLASIGQDRAILSPEQIAEYEGTGKPILWEAATLEELAQQIGVDADALIATAQRYTELYEAGEDSDFYKDAQYLYPLATPPFYAMVREYTIGGTLGAIRVTDDCQAVSRTTGEGIPGLYVVGNDMGGLQTGQDYVWHDYGMTLTSGATLGYAVGRDLARS